MHSTPGDNVDVAANPRSLTDARRARSDPSRLLMAGSAASSMPQKDSLSAEVVDGTVARASTDVQS